MKKLILILIIVGLPFYNLNAQEPIISSLEVYPTNPSGDDTIMIITYTITNSMGFQFNPSFSQLDQKIILERCFYLGVNTAGGHYKDTFLILPNEHQLLPDDYIIHYRAHTTYNESECIQSITSEDSASFSIGFVGLEYQGVNNQLKLLFPNPSTTTHTLQFNTPNNSFVTVHLYDLQGRKLKQVFEGLVSNGEFHEQMDISTLDEGVYFYAIEVDGKRQVVKFVR